MKNKTIIKISLLFLIVLILSFIVNSQNDFGCCCNPVTKSGHLSEEDDCLRMNFDFILGLPVGGETCDDVCQAVPVLPRVPVCGDGICEGNEPEDCPSDCVIPGLLMCGRPDYKPAPKDVVITPVAGEKKFKITFRQECLSNYVTIRRQKSGSVFKTVVKQLKVNEFIDDFAFLQFDVDYEYRIFSNYILNLEPKSDEVKVTANLGDLECWHNSAPRFCLSKNFYNKTEIKNYLTTSGYKDKTFHNFQTDFSETVKDVFSLKFNKAYYCTDENVLEQYQDFACTVNEVCAVKDQTPVCIKKGVCENLGPFGLFSNVNSCEKISETQNKFCFFDSSTTIVDSCFDCKSSMECYDYKSKDTCVRDNCGVDACEWHPIFDEIGVGVCVDVRKSNCDFCDKKGSENSPNKDVFNNVFNVCSEKKATALSVSGFNCLFDRDLRVVKSCDIATCRDYTQLQCGAPLRGITIASDNSIITRSTDPCHIGVCQWDSDKGNCSKNADASTDSQWPDCVSVECEADYFPPITTVIPAGVDDRVDFLSVVILDKKFTLDSLKEYSGKEGYDTFLCLKSNTESCLNARNYPYKVSTNRLILKNLDLKDGQAKIARLKLGTNELYFYSKDPSSNLEIIQSVSFDACDNCQGPTLLDVKISGGKLLGSNLYSSFTDPVITLVFDEPAKILYTSITNTLANVIAEPGYKSVHTIRFDRSLTEDIFRLTVEVENEKHIKTDPDLFFSLYIDTSLGRVAITPADGAVLDTTDIDFKFEFFADFGVELNEILLTHVKAENKYLLNKTVQDITDNFEADNHKKVFTASLENQKYGAYKLYLDAEQFNSLPIVRETGFFIGDVGDINDYINLISPRFGVSPTQTFKAVVETALKTECHYSFDLPEMPDVDEDNFDDFALMSSLNGYEHSSSQVSIPFGDKSVHPLYVFCKTGNEISSEEFELIADPFPPAIITAYAFPDIIAEEYSSGMYSTNLKIETDKKSFCKYSKYTASYDLMEHSFSDFGAIPKKTHSVLVVVDSIKPYTYYVACESPSGLKSSSEQVSFSVDLSQPLKINLATDTVFNKLLFPIGVETNKKALCYLGKDVSSLACMGSCKHDYSHFQEMLELEEGEYDYIIKCIPPLGQSDSIETKIILDLTAPVMLWVNDSSTLAKGNVSYYTNKLRAAYLAEDNLSGVSEYVISIIKALTDDVVVSGIISTVLSGSYHYIENLTLENNTKYKIIVNAVDNAGWVSQAIVSDGVLIDISAEPYTCGNGVKDGDETDVDCGGSCPACADGKSCNTSSDCVSNLCVNNVCLAQSATCNNNLLDGFETDVDCGGFCDPCYDGERCEVDDDCKSEYCSASTGRCKKKPACEDNKLSAGETDVDCGGPCLPCGEGRSCEVDVDCEGGLVCLDFVCSLEEELDSDDDGVPDDEDICPNTPAGEPVDQYGCSLSQKVTEERVLEEKGFSFLTFLLILLLLGGAGVGGYLLYKKLKEKKVLPKFKKPVKPKPTVSYRRIPEKPKVSPIDTKIQKLRKFAKKHDLDSGWLEVKPKQKDAFDRLRKSVGKLDSDVFEKLKKRKTHKSKEELFKKLKERVEEHKKSKRR